MYHGFHQRGNMFLLVPRPAGAPPEMVLATNRSTWVLLDTAMFSLDGRACDKV